MELILKDLFDINTGNRHRHTFEEMAKAMYSYFESRTYSPIVNRVVIDMICSIEYKMPYRKKPIYHEDKLTKLNSGGNDVTYRLYHLMFIDIPLPDEFATCSEEEAVPMIGQTLVKYFTETPLPLKIRKSFDKDRFIADLQLFFSNYNNKKL